MQVGRASGKVLSPGLALAPQPPLGLNQMLPLTCPMAHSGSPHKNWGLLELSPIL